MNNYFMAKPTLQKLIMVKINMKKMIIAKINVFKNNYGKPTMAKLTIF